MRRGYEDRKRRREEAEVRQAERNKRSDKEQLDRLVKAGHGRCKEAQKLIKRIGED